MLGGSALRQLVLTTALLATNDADPLQVSQYGWIGLG
jgi:hypothetical protein